MTIALASHFSSVPTIHNPGGSVTFWGWLPLLLTIVGGIIFLVVVWFVTEEVVDLGQRAHRTVWCAAWALAVAAIFICIIGVSLPMQQTVDRNQARFQSQATHWAKARYGLTTLGQLYQPDSLFGDNCPVAVDACWGATAVTGGTVETVDLVFVGDHPLLVSANGDGDAFKELPTTRNK